MAQSPVVFRPHPGPEIPHVSSKPRQACVLMRLLLLQPVLGPHMPWLVWVALAGVGIGAGMTFVPSLPALLHATRTLVRMSVTPQAGQLMMTLVSGSSAQPLLCLKGNMHRPDGL
jgi:hypothetical protein